MPGAWYVFVSVIASVFVFVFVSVFVFVNANICQVLGRGGLVCGVKAQNMYLYL